MSHVQITIDQLDEICEWNFATTANNHQPQPMVLIGAPGLGKSQWTTGRLPCLFAEAMGCRPEEVAVVIEKPLQRSAEEIAGVTVPYKLADGTLQTRFTRSPVITRIYEERDKGAKYVILFWDELAAAAQPEQKVCAPSLDPNEHAIGNEKLPDWCYVMGAGNRAKDKAGATRLLSHLTNRVMVAEIKADFIAWRKWAVTHGVNPIMIECVEAYIDDGFVVDEVPTEDGPYPTYRSIVQAARHLDAMMNSPDWNGTVSPTGEAMLAMNIGQASAARLVQWIAQRDHVPTAAEILADPEGAKVPDQTGFQMIAAHRVMGEIESAQDAEAALHYIVRLRTDLQVSLGTKLLKVCTRRGFGRDWTDPLASAFIARFHELMPLVDVNVR